MSVETKHWLFAYDDIAPALSVVEYGTKETIRKCVSDLTKGCSYIRQWAQDGMTVLDYGSHVRFLKIYPSLDIFVVEKGGENCGLES